MQRIGFYTDRYEYKGWTNWDYTTKYLEVKNWIRSGNSIKHAGYHIRTLEEFALFCKVYP